MFLKAANETQLQREPRLSNQFYQLKTVKKIFMKRMLGHYFSKENFKLRHIHAKNPSHIHQMHPEVYEMQKKKAS